MGASLNILPHMYDWLRYLVPIVSRFARNQRYLLGERLESLSCDILELLIAAYYSRNKLALLQQANVKLEQARYYVRLCKDLRLMDLHRYEVMSKMLNDIGMQLGGWIKHQKA